MNDTIQTYIRPGARAHLVGIGGVSMAPLAEVLHGRGVIVTGSDTEVVPKLFLHVHTERRRALIAVWCTIPQLVAASSDRLMSQPCKEVRKGYLPHGIDFRPFHAVRQLMMNLMPTPHCV